MTQKSKGIKIDQRIFPWILLILIVAGYIYPLGLPIPIGKKTIGFAKAMESVPSGGTIILSQDCGVNAIYNLGGVMGVVAKYYAERGDVKIIIWGTAVDTYIVYEQMFEPILEKLEYGTDYVLIGYVPGRETAIAKLAKDIRGVITTDYFGKPLDEIPLMKEIKDAGDIDMIFTFDTTDTREYYVAHWGSQFGSKIVATVVALNEIHIETMLEAGQIVAGAADIRGGAELELHFNYLGTSIVGTDTMVSLNASKSSATWRSSCLR